MTKNILPFIMMAGGKKRGEIIVINKTTISNLMKRFNISKNDIISNPHGIEILHVDENTEEITSRLISSAKHNTNSNLR